VIVKNVPKVIKLCLLVVEDVFYGYFVSDPEVFRTWHLRVNLLFVVLRVENSARHPAIVCRFCITFGREEIVGACRARTKNVKYFTTFRADGYKRHLFAAHPAQWEENKQIPICSGWNLVVVVVFHHDRCHNRIVRWKYGA
jgi:hypothetical protein